MPLTEPRSFRTRRVLAWLLAGVTVLGCAAQAALLIAAGVRLLSAESLDQAFPIIPMALVIGAVVGALIIGRHPRHRIGWLFCLGQAGAALGLAAQALATGVLRHDMPLPVAVGEWAAWVSRVFGASYALALLGLLLMLVPDGHLPSRRWRPVFVLLVGGYGVVVGGLLLISPRQLGPGGPQQVGLLATGMEIAGQLAVTVGLLGGAIALVVRLRRSVGDERQQLRWIAVAALALGLTLILYVADNLVHSGGGSLAWLYSVLFYLGYLAVPVATGFAVLRYRLYDIDLIIGSAVRFAVLAAFVTMGYIAVVVVIGAAVGGAANSPWPSLAAYVLVALAFQPLRRRVERLADRVVYGDRAAPYDSLATFGRQLSATLSDRELLTLVARSSATAFGVPGSWATVLVPGRPDVTEEWPEHVDHPATADAAVRYDGGLVGRIGLVLAPGRSLRRSDIRLLQQFADRAAPGFRNAALSAALRERADELIRQDVELSATRRRLVTAAVLQREQVAAAVRSNVIEPLLALPPTLDMMQDRVRAEPAAVAQELNRLQGTIGTAIEQLRSITAGVLPPLLTRHGLLAALHTYAGQSAQHPVIQAQDGTERARFGTSAETAAYVFSIGSVENLKSGSHIVISATRGWLRISVTGILSSSRSFAGSEWQHVLDRVQAIGGQVTPMDPPSGRPVDGPSVDVSIAAGEFTVEAVLPAETAAQISSSRSGPNSDLSR